MFPKQFWWQIQETFSSLCSLLIKRTVHIEDAVVVSPVKSKHLVMSACSGVFEGGRRMQMRAGCIPA